MQRERRSEPDRFPESLEARLRALPGPPVPGDLEARLLAAIPTPKANARRRVAVFAGVAAALAAACLLAVLSKTELTPFHRGPQGDRPKPETKDFVQPRVPTAPDESARIAASLKARRELDETKLAPFRWPIPQSSPARLATAIRPDVRD